MELHLLICSFENRTNIFHNFRHGPDAVNSHKEERWKWVDESFVKEAEVIYRWLLKNPRDKDKVLCCSFEYLLSHVKDNPTSPLAPRFDDSPYLKKYLGKDYDIIIQGH